MEIIRGSNEQRAFVFDYLGKLRETLPLSEFSKKTTNSRFDLWPQEPRAQRIFNMPLFNEVIKKAREKILEYGLTFKTLPLDRYIIGEVDAQTNVDTGGFHSRYSRGFKYLANCGFAAILSERYTTNQQVITLELARSYLHDCIHNASFRTIRVLPEGIESKFPVYREQYGINFRRANSSSYSGPHAPEESPQNINLGILMDGITVLMTAEYLKPYTNRLDTENLNDFEKIIIADINFNLGHLPDDYRGKGFHQNVTVPAQGFIEHWGGNELYEHLKKSMLTGKMRGLVKYFDSKTGKTNSWRQLFKSASY